MQDSRFAPRVAGLTILGIGLILMLFALVADAIGVGGGEGFSYQQMIVFIIGMVMALGGGALMLQPLLNAAPTGNDYRPDQDSNAGS